VIQRALASGVTLYAVRAAAGTQVPADGVLAVGLPALPGYARGVQLWRYTPWRAWTKPIKVAALSDLKPDDVQVFYWQDRDGGYAVAIPISGAGFRTTLGGYGGGLAAKAYAGVQTAAPADLPLLIISRSRDPYAAFRIGYRAALKVMGRQADAVERKTFPEPLKYLGWNTWNLSDLGQKLNEPLILAMADSIRDEHLPIASITYDDGYFTQADQRLQSFAPDPAKFPRGFAALNQTLKADYGLRAVGVWITLNGYWSGIDPSSPLGRPLADSMFGWSERADPSDPTSPIRHNQFVKPDGPAMAQFYDAYLARKKADGFDFLKVDNQLVVERMAKGTYPIFDLASAMHAGLNAAAARSFHNAVIDCMDMTADAYFNFGGTPVARSVEDYFPYKAGETYELGKGNAAAHVLQAIYNALYFGQFVYPDFDMFETTNPNAKLHAVVRAANDGPIYLTDQIGVHDLALMRSLALSDGYTLRADSPLVPTPDSLFQVQDAKLFKASSRVGGGRLLLLANLADADTVAGDFGPADLTGLPPGPVAAYEVETGAVGLWRAGDHQAVTLKRFESRLWNAQPVRLGLAAFGRSDKLNGAATLAHLAWSQAAGADILRFDLVEGGPAVAYADRAPSKVTVDGDSVPFTYHDGLVTIAQPISLGVSHVAIYAASK